jgi:hypothetical protein
MDQAMHFLNHGMKSIVKTQRFLLDLADMTVDAPEDHPTIMITKTKTNKKRCGHWEIAVENNNSRQKQWPPS